MSRLSPRLFLPIALALLLAASLVAGLARAMAADGTAPPADETVTLRVGWTTDPDNRNPFVGKLRLWVRRESPQSQSMGKLITGWWEELGLDIEYSVQDNGVLIDGGYNYDGDTYKPDYDIYIWTWQPSGSDPGRRLGYFRTVQIENRNDACWSNEEYDSLWEEQSQELDPQARKDIVWRMQEIFYNESPYIILTYPKLLQAWNVSEWEGWTRIPENGGAVACLSDNISNYALVGPKAEAEAGGDHERDATGAGLQARPRRAALARRRRR